MDGCGVADATTSRVLLTVSGTIPVDLDSAVQRGHRPRADYHVMADRLGADLIDVSGGLAATGRIGRLLYRLGGPGPLLAWYARSVRRQYDVVLTDGEQVGIPFAALRRLDRRDQVRHVMITHVLTVPRKERLIRWCRLSKSIDQFIVYSSAQAAFITDRLGVPASRVSRLDFMVDTEFFAPGRSQGAADDEREPGRPMICSAGLERRDYPTLMRAVDGLDVDVVIAAASPWSKRLDSSQGELVPSNVSVRRLDHAELRDLYASSRFVVMPLDEVDFQAGITTILEAMAMGRPVICSRTRGQQDVIVDGTTGRYVPPGDVAALRNAIERLLGDPDGTATMGRHARSWAVDHADVEVYAGRVAQVVAGSSSER